MVCAPILVDMMILSPPCTTLTIVWPLLVDLSDLQKENFDTLTLVFMGLAFHTGVLNPSLSPTINSFFTMALILWLGSRVTRSFCTMLWSKLHWFQLKLVLGNISLTPPHEHDRWLTTAFEEAGFSPHECTTLNIVCLHKQTVFESDIFNADGITIHLRYCSPRAHGENWSIFKFAAAPSSSLYTVEASSHATGPRQSLSTVTQEICFYKSCDLGIVYTKSNTMHRAQHSRYTYSGTVVQETQHHPLCTVDLAHDTSASMLSHKPAPNVDGDQPAHF
ncbi:LOW QUALITY PROTEIN: hypothetical protein ACHAW6_007779 [Cyclotella cf. meneghiniana]